MNITQGKGGFGNRIYTTKYSLLQAEKFKYILQTTKINKALFSRFCVF